VSSGGEVDGIEQALARASALVELRRHQEAIDSLRPLAHNHPADARVATALGIAHLAAGDAPGAEQWSRHALGLDPTDPVALNLRARSLVSLGHDPAEALDAATRSAAASPFDPGVRYTLVRAQLAAGDRSGARATAQSLRDWAPDSPAGPLALALVELDESAVFRRRRWTTTAIVLLTLFTRGVFLLFLGVAWIVHAIRRAPHLRRADEHLRTALAMAPDEPGLHALMAQVMALRFRYTASIDRDLAAAALDIGLADSDAIATTIARRTTVAILAVLVAWIGVAALVGDLLDDVTTAAAIGTALAATSILAVALFDRMQTSRLPPLVAANAHRQWPPLAAAAGACAWMAIAGSAYLAGQEPSPDDGYQLAAALSLPLVLFATLALLVRTLLAQRRAVRTT